MSRDGLVPASICKVHSKYKTPYIVTIVGCILVSIIGGLFPVGVIAEMANIGTLTAFTIAAVGVMVLRKSDPDLHRNFKCPAVWIVAPLAMISCLYLIYNLPIETWIRFVVWLILGLAVYFGYSRGHSVLGKQLVEKARQQGN